MKKKLLLTCMILTLILIGFSSCEKETPAPTAEFEFIVDGYTVTFTSTVTDVNTYSWDFDDSESSVEANPEHTYTESGTYTVKLTVTGDGGEISVTREVEILPSFDEMLTGGPSDLDGKTWVLRPEPNPDFDGATNVANEWPFILPVPDGQTNTFMGWIGREIDNEFTFKHDGSYLINNVNDSVLSISIFSFLNQLPNSNNGEFGTCKTLYSPPASATFTINDGEFTIDAITEPMTIELPPVHGNVTISGKKWLSFSEGSYFGILDYQTSSHVIVKSITPTEMHVVLLICLYQSTFLDFPASAVYANLPTYMWHMTYIPKS